MIDFDEIRKNVAIKHNVLLSEDDPILVTVTVNELVLGRYLDLASERYNDANKVLRANLQQQVDQSKETASKIIASTSHYVSSQVRQAVVSAVNDATSEMRGQIASAQLANRDAMASRHHARLAKNGAFLAAIVASAAAVIALAALAVVLLK